VGQQIEDPETSVACSIVFEKRFVVAHGTASGDSLLVGRVPRQCRVLYGEPQKAPHLVFDLVSIVYKASMKLNALGRHMCF
jgi:hypothetical protein